MTTKIIKNTIIILFIAISSCGATKGEKSSSTATQEAPETVKIGNQEWATKNLDVVTFRNGDSIPEAKTYEAWRKASEEGKPAWCYQANLPEYGQKYGKLYNWYAVNAPRGLAPKGYHVPSKAEWDSLVSYLGGEEVAGKKLKSTEVWLEDGNGTNESGFSGLPGGYRDSFGSFDGVGDNAFFWSATEDGAGGAWNYSLYYSYDVCKGKHDGSRGFGFSVRCLRD